MSRNKAEIHRYQDRHNSKKVWLVKYYAGSNAAYNQEINGKKTNKAFTRVKLTWLRSVLQKATNYYK